MRPKTAILLIALLAFAIALVFFFLDSENNTVLKQELYFIGFSFSVTRALAGSILVAVFIPSAYFSWKYLQLTRKLDSVQKDVRVENVATNKLKEVRDLYFHGAYEPALEKLEREHPEADGARELRAQLLMALGRADEVPGELRKPFADNGNAQTGYILAQSYFKNNANNEALSVLVRLIEQAPADAFNAYQMQLEHYERKENWAACVDTCQKIMEHGGDLDTGRYHCFRYEMTKKLGDRNKAIEHLRLLVEDAPDFVAAQLRLGELYLAEGMDERAFQVYERGFTRTKHPVFLDRLGSYYVAQGRPADAIQVFRQLMVKGENPLIRFQLGKLYFKLEMLDESLEVLEPQKRAPSGITGQQYYLAEIKARRDRLPEAYEELLALVRKAGVAERDFACTNCNRSYTTWRDRCNACGQWDTITLAVEQDEVEQVAEFPIY